MPSPGNHAGLTLAVEDQTPAANAGDGQELRIGDELGGDIQRHVRAEGEPQPGPRSGTDDGLDNVDRDQPVGDVLVGHELDLLTIGVRNDL